jgi:4-oxalocrotonate tautomerase
LTRRCGGRDHEDVAAQAAGDEYMVVHRGPFSTADKVVAWIVACVWGVGGGVGIAITAVHAHWRLGLASACALAVGVFYAVAARRGRPFWRRLETPLFYLRGTQQLTENHTTKGLTMPILTFEGGTLPQEKKKELIVRLTEAAAVTGIPEDKFIVLLRELEDGNIGVGGQTLTEVKAARGVK